MYYVGIDMGSTASKVCIFQDDKVKSYFVYPTGWSSVQTSENIKKKLKSKE